MTDTDRINICSYRGEDYIKDLLDYLTSKGIVVPSIRMEDGYVVIEDEWSIIRFPQHAQWWSIAEGME